MEDIKIAFLAFDNMWIHVIQNFDSIILNLACHELSPSLISLMGNNQTVIQSESEVPSQD